MASNARNNLKAALNGVLDSSTNAVRGTVSIAELAIGKAVNSTQSALTAASVLGDATVDASTKIGVAAVETGTDVTKAALSATTKVGVAGIETGATVTKAGIDASEKIAVAASQAASTVGKSVLDTSAETVKTTTEQVGKSLDAGILLAGHSITRTLTGLDNIGEIIAGRGALTVQSQLQKQDATADAIGARGIADKKEQLLKILKKVQEDMVKALKTIDAVQKTALLGRISIYRRAKCGFFRRFTGNCDSKMISADMKALDLFLNNFNTTVSTAGVTAKTDIVSSKGSVEEFTAAESKYNTTAGNAVTTFVGEYKVLLDKYDSLTRNALGMKTGARRRKTRRMKKRSIRMSLRRR